MPAYLHLNSINISSTYLKQGSASQNLSDAWIYVDGNLAGVYPIPCYFPLIQTGKHTITVKPGIRENGRTDTRINYPFYDTWDTTLNLVPEGDYFLYPTVPYRASTKMVYFEDFESGGFRLRPSSLHNADSFRVTKASNEVLEGSFSGRAILKENTFFEYVTTDEYQLPGNGVETFIELNYKAESDLEVGFYQNAGATVERYPLIILYKNTDWKKIYIRLTEEISTQLIKYQGNVSSFALYLKSENTDAGDKKILIDNFKLVTF